MIAILQFISWTLLLYWIHRVIHITPGLKELHLDHHRYINNNETGWHWSNLFLFNDTWRSTFDLWVSEVLPTIIFAMVFDAWWLALFYYVWAAFLQENLEHNRNNNFYPLTFGQWHMIHHKKMKKNFGLFIPIWDKIFKTEQSV